MYLAVITKIKIRSSTLFYIIIITIDICKSVSNLFNHLKL